MAINSSDFKTFNETWFLDALVEQKIVNEAKKAYGQMHSGSRHPEVTIDIINENLDTKKIEKSRAALAELDRVMPVHFANTVRLCATSYANFCDELFAGLESLYRQSVVTEWLLHSDASFQLKRYRDHLTHQMKVSLLGLSFLQGEIPGGNALLDEVVKKLKASPKLDPLLKAESITADRITSDVVLGAWLLGSLFHDIGYCFKSYVDSYRSLIEVSNLFDTSAPEAIWEKAAPAIKDHSFLVSFYSDFGKGLSQSSSPEEVKKVIKKTAIYSKNHSVIGALFLLHFLRGIETQSSLFGDNSELRKKIILMFELAALSVLTHDLDGKKKRFDISKSPTFEEHFEIKFDHYPLSFLLGLCDQLQEWGRIQFIREPSSDSQCIENHVSDCREIQARIRNRCLEVRFRVEQERAAHFDPAYVFFDKSKKDLGGETFAPKTIQELLAAYPDGRLAILNTVYTGCPFWDRVALIVEVGGATYQANDFFDVPATKQLILGHFYS